MRIPAITTGLLLVPFTIYYIHVRSQIEYLTSRNFRTLAVMSDQIKVTVDNYQTVIENACREAGKKNRDYSFEFVLTQAGLASVHDCKAGVKVGPLHLTLRREGPDVDDAWLHLKDDKSGVEAKINLKDAIGKFMPSEADAVFEDVVVAEQQEGRVLYQQSRSGLRFTDVNVFLTDAASAPSPAGEGSDNSKDNSKKENKSAGTRPVHISSRLIERSLAGPDYKIFMQPIQLSLEQETGEEYAEWLICGFVRSDHFLSESLLISYSVIEILAGLLLLAFLSFPFLKLRFMTSRERLRRTDAVFMALSLVTAASITTIFALNSYFSWGIERDQDDYLVLVAKKIQQNLYEELGLIEQQLDQFESAMQLDPPRKTAAGPVEQTLKGVKGTIYPSYGLAYWVSGDGWQRVKWTSEPGYTPLIDISDLPIYKAFKNKGERWRIVTGGQPREFLLYSTFSPNTGKNLAAFIRERVTAEKTQDYGLRYVGTANRPLSLFNPVLPPGFGYSLVTADGWTVFHSRDDRNQRENLFMECDNEAEVRSASFGGAGVMTAANYLGRGHSLYFTPLTRLENVPLTLVTFRDRALTRTVTLETLTIALALLSLYLGLLATILGAVWLCFRPRPRSLAWVWPCQKYARTYHRLGVTYLSVIVLSAAWLWFGRFHPGTLILGAGLLTLGAVIGTAFIVGPAAAWDPDNTGTSGWRSGYRRAALSLIVVIGVMPAVLFWQAARYFESSLFVGWGQRKLAVAVEARGDNRLKDLGQYGEAFYGSTIADHPGPASAAQGGRAPILDCLLTNLTIPFNQTASEVRAMVGECRDHAVRAWSWKKPPHGPFTLVQPGLSVTTARFPRFRPPHRFSDWMALGSTALLLAGLLLLMRYSASKIFHLDQSPLGKPVGQPSLPDACTKYVLALGPVSSGKSAWLDQRQIAQPIRLATMTDVNQAVKSTHLIPPGEPIAIDQFEYRLDDKNFGELKLQLLEQLVFTEKRPILIVSSVDPRYHPDYPASPRWAAVLDQFSERHFSNPAGKHYNSAWALCSEAEKLMLVHLAQGALVNPKSQAALRQLLWKGLIKSEPYRIADPEFQAFVLSVQRPLDVRRWEHEEGGGWGALRTGFVTLLAGIALILFVAQRDILQSWIPYMTGLAGWLASMSKALDGLRGGASSSE